MWQMVLITIIADKGFLTPHLMRPNPPYPLFCLPAPPPFFFNFVRKGTKFLPKTSDTPPPSTPPSIFKTTPYFTNPSLFMGKIWTPFLIKFRKINPRSPPHTHTRTHIHTLTRMHARTHTSISDDFRGN